MSWNGLMAFSGDDTVCGDVFPLEMRMPYVLSDCLHLSHSSHVLAYEVLLYEDSLLYT